MSLGIEELDLSRNQFDAESSKEITSFFKEIKSYGCLKRIGLSCCGLYISQVLKYITGLVYWLCWFYLIILLANFRIFGYFR